MIYLCNGFSESMKRDPNMKEIPYSLTEAEFINLIHHAEYKSAIGHEKLANFLTRITGKKITKNRMRIEINYEDYVIVVSVLGRLPEHPKDVKYKGKLTFSLKRFEKQTVDDLLKSQEIIEEIILEA